MVPFFEKVAIDVMYSNLIDLMEFCHMFRPFRIFNTSILSYTKIKLANTIFGTTWRLKSSHENSNFRP